MDRASLIRASLIPALQGWRTVRLAVLALTTLSAGATAQQVMSGRSLPATITFTLDFPQSNPEHYSIAVDATGHAHYECTGKVAEDSEEQTYRAEFEITAANRERIFDWAKQARYFAGHVDSGNSKLAFTGAKLLTYEDGQRSNTARYDYSNLAPVRQLTMLFQNMAGTLEYGRRLAYYHRYQKLALDDELKRMAAQVRNNELSEIQGVSPVLQQIVDDPSVINVVRARAQELLQRGSETSTRR